MVDDNTVEMTAKFTPKQITEALKAHFKLPDDARVSYQIKNEYSHDRMGGETYKVFGHAEVTFKKKLSDVL